jgi:hypothetical protein
MKETEPLDREASSRPAAPPLSREAILALARVLTQPAATVYELASGSNPSKKYILTFEASEATCTCPGFEYRGTCRHARDLKAAGIPTTCSPSLASTLTPESLARGSGAGCSFLLLDLTQKFITPQ